MWRLFDKEKIMKFKVTPVIFCILILTTFASAQIKSVYTSLSDKACKTIESNPDEGGSYLGECPGAAKYKLQLLEGDLRQSVNVISPKGKKSELNIWHTFGGFSSVGQKAEWRMKNGVPIALIIRFNVSENPEDATKVTSYLIVSKITKADACITDVVPPGKTQNAKARKLADASSAKPCDDFEGQDF
jgi:hypothetical protein